MWGFAALRARTGSPSTRTPTRRSRPITSARSRPTIDGSASTAPTILKPGRLVTCRATAAPIGPRPKDITRMLAMVQQYSVGATGRRRTRTDYDRNVRNATRGAKRLDVRITLGGGRRDDRLDLL